jgi:TolB protein
MIAKVGTAVLLCGMAIAGFCWPRGAVAHAATDGGPVGMFEGHGDVGTVVHAGSIDYDAAAKTYTINGSGNNMWLNEDDFQFAWKKMSGDVVLSANISFFGLGSNPHRKGVLMIRQTLDADSVYVDAALHGNGLTALQFREEKGAITKDIESPDFSTQRMRLEKRGDYFYLYLAGGSAGLHPAGAAIRLPIKGDFYVGIGVCSHEKNIVETAMFSNIEVAALPAAAASPSPAAEPAPAGRSSGSGAPVLYSTLETLGITSDSRHIQYVAGEKFEAPNWTRDGKALLFNRNGRILNTPIEGGPIRMIDTSFAVQCNNDHGLSPDGTLLAISDSSKEDHKSQIYIVPSTGGSPRRITQKSPSYWHGWSPDGQTLAFVGERNGEFDIYTVPAAGGEETRLTTAPGLDDGPEYSPDGNYIYFNSERTGTMQIWRMRPDGSEQEQVLSDEWNNWFPHISPDGKWMVILSYEKDVKGHPANQNVELRLMSMSDKKIKVLARLFGGQGTINVPSWSPDSATVAFVSYELLPGAAEKK